MLTHRSATTTRTPSRLPTPPPHTFHLSDMDRRVGWIEGGVIGFRGFASDVEAAHAAWVAYRAIARRLATREGRRPIPIDIERLTLGRTGDAEVVMASGQPIATLVRPGPARGSSDDSFGFEIRVPSPTDEVPMRALAFLAYRTLRKSGVRWRMWTGARDGVARQKREAREAREAHLEREVLAGMTPWRGTEVRRDARPRTASSDAVTADAPATTAPAPTLDRGMAVLGIAMLLTVTLLMPYALVVPLAAALGGLTLLGLRDLTRRWGGRPARRPASRGHLDSGSVPAAPRRGRRRELSVTATSITVVTVLVLVLGTPERAALALAGVGLAALVGRPLLAARAGWPPRRPVRAPPAPAPAVAS